MKICVVSPVYAIAGVPLAQIRLARALAERGHDVDLVIGYVAPHYQLPDVIGVNVLVWNKPKVRQMLFTLWKYLRAVKPDVVFSAEDHLTVMVLLAAIVSGSKSKISGSSRVIPTDCEAYSNSAFFSKGWFLKIAMNAVMWRANALTCVSMDMVTHYKKMFKRSSHVCVYNIVRDNVSSAKMHEMPDHDWMINKRSPIIVSAGRMDPAKGFSDLIQAMNVLYEKKVEARLIILGDGKMRCQLEEEINLLGLDHVISLPGYVDNTLKYFFNSDVFVLSSYAEGMPNVLVEAMMCGCTPVSTDCPTGPSELLLDGRYGYLVPMRDPVAMASAIEQALDNPIPKSLLAEAVRPFEEDAVLSRHFEVLGLSDRR